MIPDTFSFFWTLRWRLKADRRRVAATVGAGEIGAKVTATAGAAAAATTAAATTAAATAPSAVPANMRGL